MKNYLPSKKFMIIAGSAIGVFIVVLLASYFIKKNKESSSKRSAEILAQNMSIKELSEKDTDNDGIADWEESLWGLDPKNRYTHEGVSDADWVKQKKEELKIENADTAIKSDEELNETEKFSRELFTTINALKQSGNLNKDAISNVSSLLGEKITSVTLGDIYVLEEINKADSSDRETQAKYYNEAKKAFIKYKEQGLGDELSFVDPISGETDPEKLIKISEAYKDFSKEVQGLKVPENLIQKHLDIANSAYNTGESIVKFSKITDDPLTVLVGFSQYQRYSEEFINASEELRTYLINNGIIER